MSFKVASQVSDIDLERSLNSLWEEGYRNIQILEGRERFDPIKHETIKFYTIVGRRPVK